MYMFGKLRISIFQWFRSFFKISDFSEIFLDFTEIGGAVTEIGGAKCGGGVYTYCNDQISQKKEWTTFLYWPGTADFLRNFICGQFS